MYDLQYVKFVISAKHFIQCCISVYCLSLFSQQFQDPLHESIADEKESHHLNEVVRVKSFYFNSEIFSWKEKRIAQYLWYTCK